MISNYPNFTPLTLHLRKTITKATARFLPYSDFNFTSLFCWNVDDSTEVSLLNDNLVIKLPDYITGKSVVSILGENMIDQSIATLLEQTETIQLVPESVIAHIKSKDGLEIVEDPNNFDYIYSVYDVSHLPGQKYKKKRNKMNSFVSANSTELSVEHVITIDNTIANEILEVFDAWSVRPSPQNPQRDLPDAESAMERTALARLVTHFNTLDLHITLVRHKRELVAFSINEVLSDDYAICHFEKTKQLHPQISSFVATQAAKNLHDCGCKHVNWEQDLGLAGLRRSKMSYHPAAFLKKYEVSRAAS